MGLRGKIGLGFLGVVFLYAFFTAEEVPPQPEGVCDTDEYGCVEIPKGEPILIGTYLDHSGPKSDIGDDSLNGVLLAADYIDGSFDGENARFLGRAIAFSHKDDECNVESKHATRELLSESFDRGLVAVIGGTCDAGTLGVSDQILSDEGILLISPSTTSPWLAGPDRQPFFFRTAHNGALESESLGTFAADDLGARSVALLSVGFGERFGSFSRPFLQEGGQDSIQVEMDAESPDVQLLTEDLLAVDDGDPPDAIYLPAATRYQLPAIRATRDPRLRDVPLLIEEHRLPEASVLDAMHPRQELYIARPDLDLAGEFYEQKFLRAYRARFGAPTSSYHAHAFDATMLLLNAIEAVSGFDGDDLVVPRTVLRDAIAATKNFEGVSGILTCGDSADCNPDAPMVVRKFENGRSTVVWRSKNS